MKSNINIGHLHQPKVFMGGLIRHLQKWGDKKIEVSEYQDILRRAFRPYYCNTDKSLSFNLPGLNADIDK